VHAPQLLVSQPITVPVLPSRSRRYWTSNMRGSTSSAYSTAVDRDPNLCHEPLLLTATANGAQLLPGTTGLHRPTMTRTGGSHGAAHSLVAANTSNSG